MIADVPRLGWCKCHHDTSRYYVRPLAGEDTTCNTN